MTHPHVVFCDIDNTLANTRWREYMIGVDWDTFHAAGALDAHFDEIAVLITALQAFKDFRKEIPRIKVIGLTTRPEKWREQTIYWLAQNGGVIFDALLMRPDDDLRDADIVKYEGALAYFGGDPKRLQSETMFILDDHKPVIDIFNTHNITALQVFTRKQD